MPRKPSMYRGSEVLSISDDSEDPRFYARDEPEDDREERGKDETLSEFDAALGRMIADHQDALAKLRAVKTVAEKQALMLDWAHRRITA